MPRLPGSPATTDQQSLAAKGCGTLFFAIFALTGFLVLGVLGLAITRTLQPYFWSGTPCTIVESRRGTDTLEATTTSGEPLVIRYRYDAGGQTRESTQLDRGMKESLDARAIERLLWKYPVGSSSLCYVNPKAPEEVALRRGPLWPAAFIVIPLVFIGIGLGGIIGIWRGKGALRLSKGRGASKSKELGTIGRILFFGIFALVGGILAYFLTVRPLQKYFAAKSWPETPCEIVSSKVGSHRGSKGGTTYSVDISYRYRVGDRDFQSDTYSLMAGSSSGRAAKEAIVARYAEGSQAICYVNPNDPTDALLNRNASWWLLFCLFPLPFLAVGVVGLAYTLRSALRSSGQVFMSPSLPVVPTLPATPTTIATAPMGPVELKPEASPAIKLGGAIFLALFWNGITGIFVGFAVNSFIKRNPEWFLAIFITPFVLVGLLLLGLVGAMFLNLFNPRIRLSVNSQAIPLGGTLETNWAFSGFSSRIKRFKIILESRQETTTGHGKHRRTKRDVLTSLPLVDTTDPHQIAQGRASIEIPESERPSDDEGSTKIIWVLKVAGEIPRFPDVEDEFEFTVLAQAVR